MDQSTFIKQVKEKEIKNGTKFEVFDQEQKRIGVIGVIDTTVVYLDMPEIPNDILIGNYIFKEIKEEQ